MLVVLVAMAGFGVDVWRWWYVAQHVQRAADAGALAGVVYMPDEEPTARDTAIATVGANGYDPSAVEVRTGDGLRRNQLEVGVTEKVDNFFLSVIGLGDTEITRYAVAEYQGPVPMGSPVNQLGNDPFGDQDDVHEAPRFWLNVAAPDATTQNGDRHQAGSCAAPADNCVGGENVDYDEGGYSFIVDVRETESGPLRIQAYDPGFYHVGDECSANLFDRRDDDWMLDNLEDFGIDDAHERYVEGNTKYCSGDQDIRGRNVDTTYIVRAPDETPFSEQDNEVLCTRRFEAREADSSFELYQLLISNDEDQPPGRSGSGAPMADLPGLRFREHFRQWVDLCAVPASELQVGEYIVQVRTNANASDPTEYDPSIDTGGHNRFSLRAGFGYNPAPSNVDGSGVGLYANGRLPIYVNQNDGTLTTRFYLARLEPTNANRTLKLTFFDIGDVDGSVTLKILPPEEATVGGAALDSFSNCEMVVRGSSPSSMSNCTKTGMKGGSYGAGNFQGKIVEVYIPIPEGYDCDEEDFVGGCWTQVDMSFSGGAKPRDTTTWSANIVGDPVRLID
jgi:hypothetical protein